MYPQRPSPAQIMRARRMENERWAKLQAARAALDSHLEEHEAHVLTPAAANLIAKTSLIAKIDECERQEVSRWRAPAGVRVDGVVVVPGDRVLLQNVTLPPDPRHHPTGWISRLFWWRYG